MACGIDASIEGTKICLDDIVETTIGVRLGAVAQDGSQQIDFERIENPSRIQASTPGGEQLSDSALRSEAECERDF